MLANRLSADPGVDVLLVEAGDRDASQLISMPMGYSELLDDPATAWHYPTKQGEHWVRGKSCLHDLGVPGRPGRGLRG